MLITTKPGCDLLMVPVKKNAWDFVIWTGGTLAYWDNGFTPKSVLLPPGSWKFISTTETIKEEQAAELVACYIDNFYEDYTKKDTWESFSNAIESLKSAITAAGGNKETVYAILKKHV